MRTAQGLPTVSTTENLIIIAHYMITIIKQQTQEGTQNVKQYETYTQSFPQK